MSGNRHCAHIIVKLCTSVLTAGTDRLHRPFMVDLARQVATLRERNVQVILVSSGAVAAGKDLLGYSAQLHSKSITSLKQVFAAVGQGRLIHLYEQIFDIY